MPLCKIIYQISPQNIKLWAEATIEINWNKVQETQSTSPRNILKGEKKTVETPKYSHLFSFNNSLLQRNPMDLPLDSANPSSFPIALSNMGLLWAKHTKSPSCSLRPTSKHHKFFITENSNRTHQFPKRPT